MKKVTIVILSILLAAFVLSGCTSKADRASKNLSKAADNFQIQRQIVFYNGITGDTIAEFDELCSVGNHDSAGKISITCKVAGGKYIKNYLGLSDNVTWFAMQTTPAKVSDTHYRVIWRPATVVPNFDSGN